MTTPATTTARRIHFLFLAVSADVRREVRFSPLPGGEVEVYCFDGEQDGTEARGTFTAEQARILWASFTAGGYVWTRSFIVWPAPVATEAPAAVKPVAAPAPAVKAPVPGFESEECSRCHGTGKHSRCQMYGDTCFRCGGKGRTLTARGEAAQAYLTALRSRPVSSLMPGDVVRLRAMGGSVWTTVERIEPCADPCRSIVNGVESAPREGLLTIQGAAITMIAMEPNALVRVRQTREQSASTFAAALAYQATLTKAGTVRRAREAVAA